MAKKTINFAGRTLDQNEFTRVVRQNTDKWISYQGLKPDEAAAFKESLNDILDGVYSGRYSVTDTGALSGKDPNTTTLSGKFRKGYDPNANVMGFLNNLAGRMKETSTQETEQKITKSWNKASTMGQYISDAIFGEGNTFSKEQLTRWADNYDAANTEGIRGTTGRVNFIKEQLEKYKADIESGVYGDISDEDKQAELKKIDSLLNGGLDSWEVGKLAPWATHLLFTDKNYYETPEEKQTASDAAEAQRVKDVLASGGNPYQEGTEEYNNRARELKQTDLNNAYIAWVNGPYSPTPTSRTFEQSGYRTSDNELAAILNNLQRTDDNYFKNFYSSLAKDINGGLDDLEASYSPSNDWLGNNPGGGGYFATWKKTDQNGLNAIAEDSVFAPIASVIEPTRVFGNGLVSQPKVFTPSMYKQFAYATILEQLRKAGDLEDYKVGDNEYVLLDTMDKDGNVLVYRYSYNNPTIVKTNIRKYKDSGSDVLWQNVANKYATLNNIDLSDGTSGRKFTLSFRKEGGILSAQEGTRLKATSPDKKFEESLENMSPEQRNKAIEARQVEQANNREIRGWDDLTSIEKVRIAGIGADVASAIAAFAPGYGTAAGAVLGVGSTLGNLWADVNDPSVTRGQVWTQLGTNLGMDLISLLPGAGSSAAVGKIVKTAKTVAPALLGLLSLSTIPGAYEAAQKLVNGENLTVGELKDLSYGISALTGGVRYGKSVHTQKQILKGAPKTERHISYLDKNGKVQTHKVTEAQENQILNAKSEEDALNVLHSVTGDDKAKFESDVTYGKKLGLLNKKPKFENKPNTSEDVAFVQKIVSDNERSKQSLVKFGKSSVAGDKRTGFLGTVDRRMAQLDKITGGNVRLFATNRELALGGRGKNGYNARIGSILENEKAVAKARTAVLKELDGREYQVDKDIKGVYDELKAVNKAKHDAAKAGSAKSIKSQITANDAAITADEAAFGVTGRQEFETHWSELQAAAAKNPTKPTPNQFTTEADSKVTTLLDKRNALMEEIKLDASGKPKPTKKQADALNSIDEKLKIAIQDQQVAKTKQDEAQRTWDLAQEAARQGTLGSKLVDSYQKQDALKASLKNIEDANKASTKAYNKAKTKLDTLKKLATDPLTDVNRKDLRKTMQTTLNDKETITAERVQNFRTFLSDLVNSGISEGKINEILRDNAFMTKAKNAYKFKDGGTLTNMFKVSVSFNKNGGYVIKGEKGLETPKVEKPTVSGILGSADEDTKLIRPQSYSGAPGKVGMGINFSDLALSGIESAKYAGTQGTNSAILQLGMGLKGFYETPSMKFYKQWSSKPLEDQMASNAALYRTLGAKAASGTTDQGKAFAYNLNATDRIVSANQPLAIKAAEQIKNTVDQQTEAVNETFANRHLVGERNRQSSNALFDTKLKMYMEYLHKMQTERNKHLLSVQNGITAAGSSNDARQKAAAMYSDKDIMSAKEAYETLLNEKRKNPTAFEADPAKKQALAEATAEYQRLVTNFSDTWAASHIATTGVPYSGYGTVYTPAATFNPNLFARGGKMEAAEQEKTHREYAKILHDSLKLLTTESNKKLKSGSAYAFYRKLFMHTK